MNDNRDILGMTREQAALVNQFAVSEVVNAFPASPSAVIHLIGLGRELKEKGALWLGSVFIVAGQTIEDAMNNTEEWP